MLLHSLVRGSGLSLGILSSITHNRLSYIIGTHFHYLSRPPFFIRHPLLFTSPSAYDMSLSSAFVDDPAFMQMYSTLLSSLPTPPIASHLVNLTMIDLPGLTKVVVGNFYCFAIVGMLKSGSGLSN
ncbi:hypothetical protein Syun_016786 [Stephania yunnanensis]|uniref:Uncharacterized protein n=1 Tax=Stephania yunnanensis TaxID=152371 RepID=A0AAP0P2R9_9MAGN